MLLHVLGQVNLGANERGQCKEVGCDVIMWLITYASFLAWETPTRTSARAHPLAHAHSHARKFTHPHTHMCARACAHTTTPTHPHPHPHTHAPTHAHTHARTRTHTHTHTHTHARTHTRAHTHITFKECLSSPSKPPPAHEPALRKLVLHHRQFNFHCISAASLRKMLNPAAQVKWHPA